MQQGSELKRDRKVYSAGAGVARKARTEAPNRLQMVEKLSICADRLDQVGTNIGDHRSVTLHNRWEPHLQLSFGVASPFHDGLGLLTPRDKVLVLIHVGHHLIHLQHGEPHYSAL